MTDDGYLSPPSTIQMAIRKTENGFAVLVYYPQDMLPQPGPEGLMKALKQVQAKTQKEGHVNPQEMVSMIFGSMADDMQPKKPLRKPQEEYVFLNIESMIKFVSEVFGGAE